MVLSRDGKEIKKDNCIVVGSIDLTEILQANALKYEDGIINTSRVKKKNGTGGNAALPNKSKLFSIRIFNLVRMWGTVT